MPYIKSKLNSIYNRESEARLQASLWGNDVDFLDQDEISSRQAEASSGEGSSMMRIKKKLMAVIGACYPWIHATNEGNWFATLCNYLLSV